MKEMKRNERNSSRFTLHSSLITLTALLLFSALPLSAQKAHHFRHWFEGDRIYSYVDVY